MSVSDAGVGASWKKRGRAMPQKRVVRTDPMKDVAAVGRARSSTVPRRYGCRGQVGEQAVADKMPLAMNDNTATKDRLERRARPQMPLFGFVEHKLRHR